MYYLTYTLLQFSPSLRMRPYYIPRRLRTKSENNAEPMNSLLGHHFQDLIPAANSSELVDDDDEDDVDLLPSTSSSSVSSSTTTPFARLTHRNSMMTIDDDTSVDQPPSQELPNAPTQFDAMVTARSTVAMMEKFLAVQQQQQMRKSRSLEDICRGVRAMDAGSQASHEMEFMSSRIQKMKVQD